MTETWSFSVVRRATMAFLVLRHGADPNMRTAEGYSVLDIAHLRRSQCLITLLTNEGQA